MKHQVFFHQLLDQMAFQDISQIANNDQSSQIITFCHSFAFRIDDQKVIELGEISYLLFKRDNAFPVLFL